MPSYLITFKPKSENSTRGMNVDWLQRFAARLQNGATLKCEWRFLTVRNVRKGERAFLILQGKRGPALIGFGRLAGVPRKRNGSHCAPIAFERLVDPEDRTLADKKSLLAIGASSIWATQFSGRRIPDEVAAALELLIAGLSDDLARDLDVIYRSGHNKTTTDALVKARLGQGWFRSKLEKRWNSRCAVTEWSIPSLLRASHIKPWSKSSDDERLNPANGILLAAHVDALFDHGLISFSNDGKMMVSRQIVSHIEALQLPGGLTRKLSNDEKRFLKFHRDYVFCG